MSVTPNQLSGESRETAQWAALQRFESAYFTQSHRAIAAAWDPELLDRFPPAQSYRAQVAEAQRCVQTVAHLVTEHRLRHWQAVVNLYESWCEHFDYCTDFQENYLPFVQDARRQLGLDYKLPLQRALAQNDDAEVENILAQAGTVIKTHSLLDYLEHEQVLTPAERERIKQSLARLTTVRIIQERLAHKDTAPQALVIFDDHTGPLPLTESQALTVEDRLGLYELRRVQTRHALREAVAENSDPQILYAAGAAQAAGWSFRSDTLELIRDARERVNTRQQLDQAHTESELMIAYDDAVVNDDREVSLEKRQELETTKRLYKPLLALRRAVKKNDVRTIAAVLNNRVQMQELVPHLTDVERELVTRVQTALYTLQDLRKSLAETPRSESTLQRILMLCDSPEMVRTCQPLMTPMEKEQVRQATIAAAVVAELNRLDHTVENPTTLLAIARSYQTAQAEAILLPETMPWRKIRSALEFQARWQVLLKALDTRDRYAIFRAWNPAQMNTALDLLTPTQQRNLFEVLENTPRLDQLATAPAHPQVAANQAAPAPARSQVAASQPARGEPSAALPPVDPSNPAGASNLIEEL